MNIKKYFDALRYYYAILDRKRYIKYLKKNGVIIGNNVTFVSPRETLVDITRPYLIEIGNKVTICPGTKLLTHGADWLVLREIYHRSFGSAGRIKIGNNVFIGNNVIILKNVNIGDNVIIGTGSVITKDVPENSVIAGNPGKVIFSYEDMYKKYLERELDEAGLLIKYIRKNAKREPQIEDFREFFYLFLERDESKFNNIPVKYQVGDYYDQFMKSKPIFQSFEQFIKFYDDKLKTEE